MEVRVEMVFEVEEGKRESIKQAMLVSVPKETKTMSIDGEVIYDRSRGGHITQGESTS